LSGELLGLGVDLVDVPRFAATLARRPGLADRVFTAGERSYAAGLAAPVPSLAARFAVKEAAMKALGVGLGAIDWHDVEVVRLTSGAPELQVTGRAEKLARERGVGGWHVSITHTAAAASAIVVAVS
jgi:holo-[acyl-carrier protein] synthase